MEDRNDGQPKKPIIDFEALGMEIDKEIDNLFVPAQETQNDPMGPLTASGAATADNLPQAGSIENNGDTSTEGTIEFPSLFPEAAPRDGDLPAPDLKVVAPEPFEPSTTDTDWEHGFSNSLAEEPKPQYVQRSELPRTVESFNAAFLSLEWEFSQENIRKLQTALADLEPFSNGAKGSAAIFKILQVMLARLSARPQSATRRVFELVRDSQGLLAHILLMESQPGANEKERIGALVSRFRDMRERAIAARESKSHESIKTHEVATPELTINPDNEKNEEEAETSTLVERDFSTAEVSTSTVFTESFPRDTLVSGKMPDRWSLMDLGTWMQSIAHLLSDTIKGIDAEMERIHQMELVFGKNPALTPIMLKLAGIRGGIENRVDSLRAQQNEWLSRITWVENLQKISADYSNQVQDFCETSEPPVFAEADKQTTPPDKVPVRQDVYVFHYASRPFAIQASDLVTFRKISSKKLLQFAKRGHATLGEVKPFFRTIRNGLHGQWAAAPRDVLESTSFKLVGSHVFDTTESPSKPKMAIFVSNSRANGVILTDSEDISIHKDSEIIPETCSCHAAFAFIKLESDMCAEVLDLDRVFPED